MTQPLIKVGPGQQMMSGVKPSLDPLSSILWVSGQNVIFRKLGIEKFPGFEEIFDVGEDIFELNQAFIEGNDRAYLAGEKRVFYWEEGQGLQAIYSFPTASNVRLVTWGTWLLMTNGVNPLKLWKDEEVVDIDDLPFVFARLIHRSNVHVLAANTSNGDAMIEWCAASNVENWLPSRANSAGNYFLRDLDGEIIAMLDLGKQISVYSSEKLITGRWTGQPFTFLFDPALDGIGAVGARSVVSVGNRNIGLARQGVFETDGVGFGYADEPDVHTWLQDNVDWTQGERIVGYNNELLQQVIWHFPKVGGGYAGIPYSYVHRVFGGELTTQVTAVAERFVFDTPIAVVGGKFIYLNSGVNAGSAALPSSIMTKPLDAGEGGLFKLYDYLRVTGKWTGGKVRLGALENPNDLSSIEWFVDEAMAREHFFERDTPYIVLEFSTSELAETFSISQFVLGGEPAGFVV